MTSNEYNIYGARVISHRALRASRHSAVAPGPTVHIHSASSLPPPNEWLLHKRVDANAEPWMSVAKVGRDYRVRCGAADYLIHERGTSIIEASSKLADDARDHLLLDHVLPSALQVAGVVCLHASSVERSNGAALLVGTSGSGKSTLATALASSGGFIADDCAALYEDGSAVVTAPGPPHARLREDVAQALGHTGSRSAGKRHVDLPGILAPSRVAMVILVERASGQPALEPLDPQRALQALLPHVVRIDPFRADLLRREYDVLLQLTQSARVFRLAHVHDYAQLPYVRELIEALA